MSSLIKAHNALGMQRALRYMLYKDQMVLPSFAERCWIIWQKYYLCLPFSARRCSFKVSRSYWATGTWGSWGPGSAEGKAGKAEGAGVPHSMFSVAACILSQGRAQHLLTSFTYLKIYIDCAKTKAGINLCELWISFFWMKTGAAVQYTWCEGT